MSNKTAFVTGASAGFGEAIAEQLAAINYNLILLARRAEKLESLKNKLSKQNPNIAITLLKADVRDYKRLAEILPPVLNDKGVDVLVNNAGLALGLSEISEGDVEDWNTMIDTNIKGVLYVSKLVLPFMIKQQSGYIINVSSIAGKEVYANGNVYCASKHAVDAIGKSLRMETARHGIRVTNINPGAAETEFSVVRFKGDAQKAANVYRGFEPLRAADIAETVAWLLTRPPHVNINELTIMPASQPVAGLVHKK